ncbi:MAG: sporulation protein, partial [Polyangiaceae bacterium]|nr:sporulation protein [Polyangiaceae bacterium]
MGCDVVVHVETEGPYRAGDHVRGAIQVTASSTTAVERALVRLGWQTWGVGDTESFMPDVQSNPGFVVEADQKHEIPFDLVVPDGPVSFRGELVNVSYLVRAELEVDWAKNPKAEATIEVIAPDRERAPGAGYRAAPKPIVVSDSQVLARRQAENRIKRVGAIISLSVGAAFIVIVAATSGFASHNLIFVGAALFIAWRAFGRELKNKLVQSSVGTITFTADPLAVVRGGDIQLSVTVVAKKSQSIAGATATVECTEYASRGSGEDRTTQSHVAESHSIRL